MVVRKALLSDASGIARVHVETWQSAYDGILADEYLRNLSCEKGERQWQSVLGGPNAGHVHVAEDEAGSIAGFASGGQSRDDLPLYSGELYAVYVLPGLQRRGLGRRLVAETARSLAEAGMSALLTWTLADNPSRAFYETLGGVVVARKEIQVAGGVHEVVAYGWPDSRVLLDQ